MRVSVTRLIRGLISAAVGLGLVWYFLNNPPKFGGGS
jgi:hypothetical protein